MENLPSNIYHRIQELSFEVKQELRKKGIVAPVKYTDGSVGIGFYRIIKRNGAYTVLYNRGEDRKSTRLNSSH